MSNIAFISDIHGNLDALDAVLADIHARGMERVFCLGDLVGYGPWPGEVIGRIRADNIPTIMGNYDEAVGFTLPVCGCHINDRRAKALSQHALKWAVDHTTAQDRAYLRALPESLSIEVAGVSFLLNHASMDSITEYVYQIDAERMREIAAQTAEDVYVYGHTHFPFHEAVGGKHIINAGSVGRPKDGDNRAGYVAAHIENGTVSTQMIRVGYDVNQVVADMRARGIATALCRFLQNGGEK